MLRAYSKSAGTGKARRRSGGNLGSAADYADHLLATFDCAPASAPALADPHPALAWAACGAMALTGRADGPPVATPGHLAAAARDAVRAFAALAGEAAVEDLDGAALLGERAAITGRTRRGRTSVGGSCRLLRARDGWLAVNLPRPEDVASVPAWLECGLGREVWETVAGMIGAHSIGPLVARARLLGIAAAVALPPSERRRPWVDVAPYGRPVERDVAAPPVVVDLSSLWAGPLCTHLLLRAGARVIKVESTRRPDGARRGPPAFFDLLNADKESVALDFGSATDRRVLRRLLTRADMVVESARPRALPQLGCAAEELLAERPGLTWISITGYGRSGAGANRAAFGDDAATAAGLAVATGRAAGDDAPLFCADAIADPLTGVHAAVAALAAWRRGGGVLASLALRDVAAHALTFGPPGSTPAVTARTRVDGTRDWEVHVDGVSQRVLPPRARRPFTTARPLGADTERVLHELHV